MSIYAVNGKEPIAAWIPSLDTAGNGTTTLTDLVGSNNGTLTNMDAATDWVADTGAGGVRALDFDGADDYVLFSGPDLGSFTDLSVSLWCNVSSLATFTGLLSQDFNPPFPFSIRIASHKLDFMTNASTLLSPSNLPLNEWVHVACVNSTASGKVIYINGSSVATATKGTIDSNDFNLYLGLDFRPGFSREVDGLLDDIRIFSADLTATDVAALYAEGLGRGITFGGVDKWALLRRGNRMGKIGVMSSPNQHIARGIRMAQMGITI